ncbi:MAG: hypothetical protein VR65_01320 [Desulfobulbaceae bacterium BRH_c16a]|nr:MAG: hypothetical protein VR65_01320 [Desulfobulbaceae bacterium BRH_c16a]
MIVRAEFQGSLQNSLSKHYNIFGIKMHPFLHGVLTGLLLQSAIGPVFFSIVGITIDSNYINSLWAILSVTIVDYIYISVALIGAGKLSKTDIGNTLFRFVSSFVLAGFGILLFYKGIVFNDSTISSHVLSWSPLTSFVSCFVLTISSPLTMIFWGSIFAKKAIEQGYSKRSLLFFGLGAGASTFIFLSMVMFILSLVKSNIPTIAAQISNCIVGIVLIYFGISRSVKIAAKPA